MLVNTIVSHEKSNQRIFTVRQHVILLALKQYENKTYRMFVEWLMKVITSEYF